jgi:peptidoglycan hydrolase-like protein with peptidoglycan-binding domain
MPLADRIAIQFDLAWTGDYNGLINGEVSDRTTAAIKAFQRKRKLKETGVLNEQERASLAAAAKAMQAQVGWRMVDDPVTGARLGLPPGRCRSRARARPAPLVSAQGRWIETFRSEPGTTPPAPEQQKGAVDAARVNLLRRISSSRPARGQRFGRRDRNGCAA